MRSSRSSIGTHILGELCDNEVMERRETQRQFLDRLVQTGRLDKDTADEIRRSPIWSLTARELVSYLAGLIIFSGVVRIVAEVFRGASEGVIATVILIAALLVAAVAYRMPKEKDILSRLAEVLEGASLVGFSSSAAIYMGMTDLKPESIVVIIGVPLIAWGWWRTTGSRFIGTVAMCVGIPMSALGTAQLIRQDSPIFMASTMLTAGAVMWLNGQRDIGAAILQRLEGCYFVLMGSFIMMGELNGVGKAIPIITGAVLFILGSANLQVEALGAGAIAITVGMTVAMGEWLPSEFTRGLTTIAVGVAMLAAVGAQLKRGKGHPHSGPTFGQSTRA